MTIEGIELTPSHVGRGVVSVGCPCGLEHCGVLMRWDGQRTLVRTDVGTVSIRAEYLRWFIPQPADERDGAA